MSLNLFDQSLNTADGERARLFEIVVAANSSTGAEALAAATTGIFERILSLQFGFFLLFAPARLLYVKGREISPELERALETLEMPPAFFAARSEPHALDPLVEQLDELLTPYQPAAQLVVPLCAAETMVGVMVLASTPTADKSKWQALEGHTEFLNAVGTHTGAAVQRFLELDRAQERENELDSFLNNAEDGYWQTDGQGRITVVNEAALRTLKRTRAEVMGKRIDELSDADSDGLERLRDILQREGGVRDFILKVRDSEGKVHVIRETMQLSRDAHGSPKKIHGIFRDITDDLHTQQQVEQSNRELRRLHELATRLNNTLGEQDMLDASLDLILSLTHTDAIAILLIHPTEGHFDLAAHKGLEPELVRAYGHATFNRAIYEPTFDPETTRNLIEYMILTQRIMTMDEFRAMPRFDIQPILTRGYLSLLAFPIRFDQTMYGIVMVGSKQENAYDRRTLTVVESISAQLGLTLRNQQLLVELQTQLRQMRTLTQTGRKIQYAPTAEEGLPEVIREIRQALGASYVVLQLVRGENLQIVAASDERETQTKFTIAAYEHALLKSDEPLIVNDTAKEAVDAQHLEILNGLGMRAVVGVRLFAHAHTLGILFVNHEQAHEWTPNDIQLIQRFALQIAYALENKRLLDEIRRQVSELHSLARAGRLIGAAFAPDDALPAIAEEIARVFPADYVSFHLREGDTLKLIAESIETNAPRSLPILPPQHVILSELQPILVTNRNVDAAHMIQTEWLARFDLMADLGVPLVSGNKALGILYISQRHEHAWTPDELRLAQTYATQVTAALLNARLLRESQGQVRELQALARSAHLISSSRSPENALPEAATELRRVLGVDYVGFHFVEGDFLHAITEVNSRWSDLRYPIEAYHRGVLDYFQRIVVHERERDALDAIHLASLEQHGIMASVGVALVSRGIALGILFVSHMQPRTWQPAELRLIATYAQQIAGVVDTVQLLNERTERLQGLAQLATFNEILVNVPDEDSITELALTEGKDLLKADMVSVTLLEGDHFRPSVNSTGKTFAPQPPLLSDWVRKIIHDKVPFVKDTAHPFEFDEDMQAREQFYQTRCNLFAPMVTAHENIGILCFSFRAQRTFSKEEMDMAQTVANQLAMAYANASLVRTQNVQIDKLTENSRFSLWCGAIHESDKLQELAIERICKIIGVAAGSIRLVDGDALTHGVSFGFKRPKLRDPRIPISPHLTGVIARKQTYPVQDIENTPDVPKVWVKTHREEGFGALLMVPMIAEHRVMGIASLYHSEAHVWTMAEIQSAETLVNILALAISNTQQIEKTEQRSGELQATLDSVFSGVFVTDADGAIILWNRKAEEITGVTEAEMQGKHWDTDGPGVGKDRRYDRLVLEAMTENQVRFSVAPRYWEHPDGRQILMRLVATPLHDHSGKIRGAVAAFWDRNQEQEGERAKLDFVNEVAHELGNKVGAVIAASEPLLNTKLSPARRAKYIAVIESLMEYLEGYQQRLTKFQSEHIHEEIESGEYDLTALLQERIAILKTTKNGHKFKVTGKLDFVRADRNRLVSIIENLLNNAIKYAAPRSHITIHGRYPSPGELELSIHNRGKPIPTELQSRIFERGVRGDNTQPGRGMGLWLVQTKLYEIGGTIRFTSSARGGTTFFVTLQRSAHALPTTEE